MDQCFLIRLPHPVQPMRQYWGTGVKWTTGRKENALRRIKKPGITPKKELRIAAWNVRTGHQVGQKEIIARELTRCKISIAALSELRMNGSGTATIKVPDSGQAMTLYYSGGDEHREGVGFMLSNRVVATVAAFQPVSSRIAVISVSGTVTVHILCIYAPTEMSPDLVKDEIYGQLQRVVDAIPQSELVVIAGDFNAHVGADRQGWEGTLGRFGVGEVNDNGLRFFRNYQ
ncbi:hypothetical protein Y032_0076g1060 [Ancylostoma ceylanicum]|uniref:Endonuclease/exonuclease/phosphatase domain-containing protein n=1 Tax=Ancylostoma ceylanicum TaxID=53326 RepID=A0A016TVN4_9BILA|nr:hypothetical protein Y032_0076g1060 [Ancylostoma ceylanicum]